MMGIYDINGRHLLESYNINGVYLDAAYDINRNIVYQRKDQYIEGRELVFEDDFDGDELNSAYWIREVGNIRNNNSPHRFRPQNVTVENSMLVLTAKRENYIDKSWTSGSITSGSDNNPNMPKWLYGRIEAKIKFPNVLGAFAAFWTVGSNSWRDIAENQDSITDIPSYGGVQWTECGEIDIVETIPGNAKKPPANLWDCSAQRSLGSSGPSFNVNTSDWHIYSMEWTTTYIAILIDDREFKRWTFSDYREEQIAGYKLPHRILLDLAVGTAGGQPPSSVNEMKMYVDWVRVYAPLT